jgi:predicted metalloprotease with PDZ domain
MADTFTVVGRRSSRGAAHGIVIRMSRIQGGTPMRPLRWLPFVALLIAAPALAVEPKCPLDLATCLNQFQRMRERPWLGVGVDRDSLGRLVVQSVEPKSPSQRAGIHPGDVIQRIEGKAPQDWFAGKAGWRSGDIGDVDVIRDEQPKVIKMKFEEIPEDVFARIIGVHMVEGHLAHLHDDDPVPPKK